MGAVVTRRRFTVEEYHCMGEAGILRPDERTELLGGEVIVLPPIGVPHNAVVLWLNRLLSARLGDRCIVGVQGPLHLPDDTEPQPDIMLLRLREDGYRTAIPRAEDVLLVIEVSDTTLRYDRDEKLPRYAASGIPESWIVNLPDSRVEVYRDPAPDRYRAIATFGREGAVTPLAFADVRLPVSEILP